MDYRFFLEVPPFEELQDPDSSPRREEVGRPTLGDYGGFLLPFFYRARFRESTSTTRKRRARNVYPNETPIASGVEESNSPRRALLLLLSNSPGGHYLKKKHVVVRTATWRSSSTSPKKVRKVGKTRSTIMTSRFTSISTNIASKFTNIM